MVAQIGGYDLEFTVSPYYYEAALSGDARRLRFANRDGVGLEARATKDIRHSGAAAAELAALLAAQTVLAPAAPALLIVRKGFQANTVPVRETEPSCVARIYRPPE